MKVAFSCNLASASLASELIQEGKTAKAAKHVSFSGYGTNKNAGMAITSNTIASIAFQGSSIIQQTNQVYISNLFEVNQLKFSPKKGSNPPFLVSVNDTKSQRDTQVFVEQIKTPIFTLQKTKNAKVLPQAVFKAGKFDPTVEFIDKENKIKVKFLAGSEIVGSDFNLLFPGEVKNYNKPDSKISFTGKGALKVVTYYNERATKDAVELYINNGFKDKVAIGDFAPEMQKDEPTIMILAGGHGTRLFDYTGKEMNKPASYLPTDPNYRMIGNAMDQAAKAGLVTEDPNELTYLSGRKTIKGANVEEVEQDIPQGLGDGGCIAKAIALGKIDIKKPLIILNADTVTNADITRAYKAYQEHSDAAIMIPYYAAPKNRAKDFGLMAATSIDGKTSEINSFVEKPKTTELAEPAKIKGTDTYMANPGIYILSPEALVLLGKKGDKMLKQGGYELGLAKNFITPLVRLCKSGKMTKEDGTVMKTYTTPLEATGGKQAQWDDLGRTSAILEMFRHIAAEVKTHGLESKDNKFHGLPKFLLEDAVKNTDLDTGVVYMSEDLKGKLELFKKKYGITKLEGNVLVTKLDTDKTHTL